MAIRYPVLVRHRGDDFVRVITITKGGAIVDITGRTYLLTVNSSENPTSTAGQILQEVGTVPMGTDGKVHFTPSGDMDALVPTPESAEYYYYDIQETVTATGLKRTIAKGRFQVKQDITKD